MLAPIRSRTRALGSRIPGWAKPSKVTAVVGVTTGVIGLVFTPRASGDNWMKRIRDGYNTYQDTKNPFDLLNYDGNGYGVIEVAAAQLQENAPRSIATIAGYGLVAGALSYFGL